MPGELLCSLLDNSLLAKGLNACHGDCVFSGLELGVGLLSAG